MKSSVKKASPTATTSAATKRQRPVGATASNSASASRRPAAKTNSAPVSLLDTTSSSLDRTLGDTASSVVLLRCADGSGLNDTARLDSSQPHPHRPPLRSLRSEEDVLHTRIAALGAAILQASNASIASNSSAIKTGRRPSALFSAPIASELGSRSPQKPVPVLQRGGATSVTFTDLPADEAVNSGISRKKNPPPIQILLCAGEKTEKTSTTTATTTTNTNNNSSNSSSTAARNPSSATLSRTSPLSRAQSISFEAPVKTCSSVSSAEEALKKAICSPAEQKRAEEMDTGARELLQCRLDGPGLVLASSAAPLYDEAYAAYLTPSSSSAVLTSKGATAKSKTKEAAHRDPTYSPASRAPNGTEWVQLETLGGVEAPAVLQRSPMSPEEVANSLYIAARTSRTSVERNYYQVLYVLWQSPITGSSSVAKPGDPLPTGASTHRRRRLETRYMRDCYTRMPLGQTNLSTSSSATARTGQTTIGGGPKKGSSAEETPPAASPPSSSLANADGMVRLSFLLRFDPVVLSTGDLFPGKLMMPRGHFTVSLGPEEREGKQRAGEDPGTARYADQCVDWQPLYPRVLGAHIYLPMKIPAAHPHLMDYAMVPASFLRPHHDRGGILENELPERIAFHVLLAPSSVSSHLLPTLAAASTPRIGTASPLLGNSAFSNRGSALLSSSSSSQQPPPSPLIKSSAQSDVLVVDTEATPSSGMIVVSASAHRHIRRRTLFGASLTTTGPNHRLQSTIFLNVAAPKRVGNAATSGKVVTKKRP